MTLASLYEERAGLPHYEERAGDEDGVGRPSLTRQGNRFSHRVSDRCPGSWNTLGWHGTRISGSSEDHTMGQREEHFCHFRNGLVAHHAVYDPDAAAAVKALDVAD